MDIKDNDNNGKINVNDFLKMTNDEILQMNGVKKFDICLMNPPYSNKHQFLDMSFIEKCNKISNKLVVVHPAKKWISETKIGKHNAEGKHLKSVEILNANEAFRISTEWKYVGIFEYDNLKEYENITATFNGEDTTLEYNDFEARKEYYKTLDFSDELKSIVERFENLYKELISKYKTMVNDGHGFVYEEKDLKRGAKCYGVHKDDEYGLTWQRHELYKLWLKDGTYKYCLYKGSFNNNYNEVQEWKGQDPYELFSGQILWLTNKKNVKNNIKYWLECPLCDMWRRYKLKLLARNNVVSGCAYGQIPALDFEMNENDFKEYVDSLNDFTSEEIKVLKNSKVHNADKF